MAENMVKVKVLAGSYVTDEGTFNKGDTMVIPESLFKRKARYLELIDANAKPKKGSKSEKKPKDEPAPESPEEGDEGGDSESSEDGGDSADLPPLPSGDGSGE